MNRFLRHRGRIAQLVRALPLQGRGHRFNPCSAYHAFPYDFFLGAVVQPGLGRQIVNLEVAGSNPVGPASFFLREAVGMWLMNSGS